MMPMKSTCHLMMTLCITTWFMNTKQVSSRNQPRAASFSKSNIFVKVKLKPYHTHAVYMHAYVDTGADVNLMP